MDAPKPADRGLPEYEQLLEMRLGRDDTDLSDVRFLMDRLGLSEAATPEEKLFSQSLISFSLQPSHHFDSRATASHSTQALPGNELRRKVGRGARALAHGSERPRWRRPAR